MGSALEWRGMEVLGRVLGARRDLAGGFDAGAAGQLGRREGALPVTPLQSALLSVTVATVQLLASAFLAVASYFALKIVFEPAWEVRRVIGRIAHALSLYANVYSNVPSIDPERYTEAQRAIRDLCSDLEAAVSGVPRWSLALLAAWRVLPAMADIAAASRLLIGIS